MTTSNKFKYARNVLETSMTATVTSASDFSLYEIKEKMQEIIDNVFKCLNVDYCLDLPCGEVRIISEDHIEDLWTDSLIDMIKDCYDLSDVPSFVEIDWEQTAANCKVDGMGHHFAGYDHEEHNTENLYIFRTN